MSMPVLGVFFVCSCLLCYYFYVFFVFIIHLCYVIDGYYSLLVGILKVWYKAKGQDSGYDLSSLCVGMEELSWFRVGSVATSLNWNCRFPGSKVSTFALYFLTDKDHGRVQNGLMCCGMMRANLFSFDEIRYLWRPIDERFDVRYQIPIVKHRGSSIMKLVLQS